MTSSTILPVPGPLPSVTYTVHVDSPSDSSSESVSRPGDMVTVAIQNHNSSIPIILSFVLGSSQAQPWLDHVTTSISLSSKVYLHAHSDDTAEEISTPAVTVTLRALTRPEQKTKEDTEAEATKLREEGNAVFKDSTDYFAGYKKAVLLYLNVLDRLRRCDPNPALMAKLHSNIAISCVKTCLWTPAIAHCDAALSYADCPIAKLFYRRALAYVELDHGVRAYSDLKFAHGLNEKDALVLKELNHVTKEYLYVTAKRRDQFAEVYNVMCRSELFKNPLLLKEA